MLYIIMCGGIYPKFTQPRWLLPFCGDPLVARTIRLLRENKITDIAISGHDEQLEQFNVPVLKHENNYVGYEYNRCTGLWCEAFYPMDDPACYLFGDVVYSPEAIKTIIDTQTDDIMFFGSAPPFSPDYPKPYIEPFGFKVQNQQHLHEAIDMVKKLDKEGKFHRQPIAWEVWNVIHHPHGNVNEIVYNSYVHINDWTTDIDKPSEVGLLNRLAHHSTVPPSAI